MIQSTMSWLLYLINCIVGVGEMPPAGITSVEPLKLERASSGPNLVLPSHLSVKVRPDGTLEVVLVPDVSAIQKMDFYPSSQ